MAKSPYGVSITVGDAMPEAPIEELIVDLSQRCHDEAVPVWGAVRGCTWQGFAAEPAPAYGGGRTEFEAAMVELSTPPAQRASHLALWDEFTRPVAIVHLTPRPEAAAAAAALRN